MNTSENIAELATALTKAQGSFTNPSRTREVEVTTLKGIKYKFKYATLDGIMDMLRKPLADNGLSLVHSLLVDTEGTVCETRLIHASGQWIATWVPVLVSADANAQGWGGALTYARRYGISTLLAVASEEDDDANAACGNEAKPAARAARTPTAPPPTAKTLSPVALNSDARQRIEQSKEPEALLTVAERIRDSKKLDPAAIVPLLVECEERLWSMAQNEIKTVGTAAAATDRAAWWAKCLVIPAEKRTQIVAGFGAVVEGLEGTAQ
jgi:hypothetical protein